MVNGRTATVKRARRKGGNYSEVSGVPDQSASHRRLRRSGSQQPRIKAHTTRAHTNPGFMRGAIIVTMLAGVAATVLAKSETDIIASLVARYMTEDDAAESKAIVNALLEADPKLLTKPVRKALSNPEHIKQALELATVTRTPGLLGLTKKLIGTDNEAAAFKLMAIAQDTGSFEFLLDAWKNSEPDSKRFKATHAALAFEFLISPKAVEKLKPWLKKSGPHAKSALVIMNKQFGTKHSHEGLTTHWKRLTTPLYRAAKKATLRGTSLLSMKSCAKLRRLGDNYVVAGKARAQFQLPSEIGSGDWIVDVKVMVSDPAEQAAVYFAYGDRNSSWAGIVRDKKWTFRTGKKVSYSAPAARDKWNTITFRWKDLSTGNASGQRTGEVLVNGDEVLRNASFNGRLGYILVMTKGRPVTVGDVAYRKWR